MVHAAREMSRQEGSEAAAQSRMASLGFRHELKPHCVTGRRRRVRYTKISGKATRRLSPWRYTASVAKTASARLTHLHRVSLGFVVDLVNGWGTIPRHTAREADQPYPGFAQVEAAHGLEPGRFGAGLEDGDLVGAADALYPAFSASNDQVLAAHLNSLLEGTTPSPRLSFVDGRLTDGWAVHAGRAALVAACALALRDLLTEQGNGRRLGVCSDDRCADAYVDASPAGHKRFCDVTCQNRARVNAFRRARRNAGPPLAAP
jgi:CGNR zinc finger